MDSSIQEYYSPLRSETCVVTYDSPFPIYAMAFSSAERRHIAVGSFVEEINNRVDILSFDEENNSVKPIPSLSIPHPYPPTKLMFHPAASSPTTSNLLASSGEHLRLWEIQSGSIEPKSTLMMSNVSKTSGEYCGPLTSFDWNESEPRRIGTSSLDTTCTIWDVEKGVVETQLIAHDKEVYDIGWCEAGVFGSVSGDGSVRLFDLRHKERSTILYESPDPETRLFMRLAWNKQDLRYVATFLMDSNKIVILDTRHPKSAVAELEIRHRPGYCVNAVSWAPHSCGHMCSGGDDGQALLWDLLLPAGPIPIDPVSMYSAGAEINQLHWPASHPDWIAVALENKIQMLKV